MTTTAKVFMSGRSQAVRLPKEFRFDVDEVLIEKTPDGVLLRTKPKAQSLKAFFDRLEPFPESFLRDRHEGIVDAMRDPFTESLKTQTPSTRKKGAGR